jgi:hypothetical protein
MGRERFSGGDYLKLLNDRCLNFLAADKSAVKLGDCYKWLSSLRDSDEITEMENSFEEQIPQRWMAFHFDFLKRIRSCFNGG